MIEVIDPGGTTTVYGYDLCDRLTSLTRHGKVRERYAYDKAGNLIARLDSQGEPLLELSIGPGNLVRKRSYGTGEAWHYDYDDRGRMLKAQGPTSTCTFASTHDGKDCLDVRDGLGVEHRFSSSQVVQTALFGRFVTSYRLIDETTREVVDPTGAVVRVVDHGFGLLERRDACGWDEVSQYDLLGRCLARIATSSGQAAKAWTRTFAYSGEGDLLSRSDSQHGITRYDYDAAHRLKAQHNPDGTREPFVYDAAGNLQKAPGLGASFAAGNLLFSTNDEHVEHVERDHICARHSAHGTTHYTYNGRDQLCRVESPGLVYEVVFDGLGRRIEKTVNQKTTRFYWDGDRLAAEIDPRGQVRVYVYADEVVRTPLALVDYDSLEADPTSGRRYMVLCTHQGCPERVVDASGKVMWEATIEAYGLAKVRVGQDFHQTLRWPGHYFDAETGLQDNRFRTYDPALGRYLQSDPIGLEGGLNLYAYTDNPLRDVDLRGYNGNANCAECQKAGKKCDKCEQATEKQAVVDHTNDSKKDVKAFKWSNPASRPTYGHTFSDHSAKLTPVQMTDRARALGHQVGK